MRKLQFLNRLVPIISKTRKFAVLCSTLLASIAWGGDSAYFPLEVGNLWVYETGGTRCCTPVVLEIVDRADFNDNTYFLLRGFPRAQGDYWVRINENGRILPAEGVRPSVDLRPTCPSVRIRIIEFYKTKRRVPFGGRVIYSHNRA